MEGRLEWRAGRRESRAMSVVPIGNHILLTGGRGRLAGIIRQHFSARGAQVTSLSRMEGSGHFSLENLFTGDLVEQADTLIHLAWSTVPSTAERNVGQEWEQDIPLLINLLKRLAQAPTREKLHLIFLSSGGTVYGNARDNCASRESDACEPIGRYGQAKLAAERLVEEFGCRHKLRYTILRVSNPYGFPATISKAHGLVPLIVKSARDGSPLSIWGDGTARKDFLFHTDFSAALEEVVLQRLGGVFNVGSGKSHSINEVIDLVEQLLGCKVQRNYGPAHAWDVHDSLIDHGKLSAASGWRPIVPLNEGIAHAVAMLR